MFSSAFKIKSSVVTATALIASVSLVLGRPQDRRLQARIPTSDLDLILNANHNAFTVPSPSEFLPSSPDGSSPLLSSLPLNSPLSSPPLNGFPNLGFVTPETLRAVPQAPGLIDSFVPLGLSTDWTKTGSLPVDGASDAAAVAAAVAARPNDNPDSGSAIVLATDAVTLSVDSISNKQFTYGFFGTSKDLKSLVPIILSNQNDWDTFAEVVRTAPPSYALHRTRRGMLLIYTTQNNNHNDLWTSAKSIILDDNFENFQAFVKKRCQKMVDATQVWDEASLDQVIRRYHRQLPLDRSVPI